MHGGNGVGLVERGTRTGLIWKVALADATTRRLIDYRDLCRERAEAVHTTYRSTKTRLHLFEEALTNLRAQVSTTTTRLQQLELASES